MAGNTGRRVGRVAIVTSVAVLAAGLAGCGTLADEPRSGQSVAMPDGTTGSGSPGSSTTTPPALSTSTRPTPTAAPTRTVDPTRTASPTPTAPSAKPKPKPKPSTSREPTPAPSTSPDPKPSTSAQPPRQDLRPGDRGPEVLAVQKRLSRLGYWLGEPDGHFGSLTQQAVWALQKSAGLSRDGTVGPRTKRALADGIRPSTRLSGNGVDIDLRRQVLLVVRGGEVRYILNTSTGGGYEYEARDGGVAIARTPKGTFRVGYVVDGRDEGRLGAMWRPRYFNGGYAVHGSPSIPPYPASHGCARVSNAAMDMIWARDFMPKGSTVLVR